MKLFRSTLLAILIPSYLFGQNLDSCGLDNLPLLNKQEGVFLNDYFRGHLHITFDFSDKRFAFITGSNGATITTKSAFFNSVKKYQAKAEKIQCGLYVFTETETHRSGGYDAIITYWVKILPNKKRIIERLRPK
jgi:hypothetical protein